MSALDEEAVDWGDVNEPMDVGGEEQAGEKEQQEVETADAAMAEDGDDVISLGGVEELEEEVAISAPVDEPAVEVVAAEAASATSNGKVEEAKEVKEEEAKAVAPVAATPKVVPAPAKPLPAGWRTQEARSGGTYYYNTVTGKTTWDFPTEEAAAPAPAPPKEVTPPERLGGIQIKGSARGNASGGDRKDQDITAPPAAARKREAESQATTASTAEGDRTPSTQKRRRSRSPEAADAVASRKEEPSRSTPGGANGKVDQGAVKGGWGRRSDIASEANGRRGGREADNRRPYDHDRRGPGPQADLRARDGDAREQPRRRDEAPVDRARGYQRGGEGARKQVVNGDRQSLAREERPPREAATADTQSSASVRQPDTAVTPSGPRDRRSERDSEVERRPQGAARADNDGSRPTPDRRPRELDLQPAEGGKRGEGAAGPPRERDRNDRRSEQRQSAGYSRAGYNYMDRGDGGRPPRGSATPDIAVPPAPGYGPQRGYHPRGRQYEAPYSPVSPANASSPAPGRGPPSTGAQPARPRVAGEEKQKRWWNKNSGERKPVSDDGPAEVDSPSARREGPRSSSSVEPSASSRSAAPADRRTTDRERELAEREAAIARKEKELGLR